MRISSCEEHPKYRALCPACQRLGARRFHLRQMGLRPALMPPDQVRSRLRSLRAAGYSAQMLAHETGMHSRLIVELCSERRDWVKTTTAATVDRVWWRLRDVPGGDVRAARSAARQGWKPPRPPAMPEPIPEDYVDAVAVQRAIGGDSSVCLTRAEKVAAWDALGARGVTDAERERVLRMGRHSVERWRGGYTRKKRTA